MESADCGAGWRARRIWLTVMLVSAVASVWLLSVSRSTGAQPASDEGVAAFARIASVLQSPRCIDCNPRGDRPAQGNDHHVHIMNIQRGPDGMGMPVMRCSTCHRRITATLRAFPARRIGIWPRSRWAGLA